MPGIHSQQLNHHQQMGTKSQSRYILRHISQTWNPKQSHGHAIKYLARYLLGTRNKGIIFTPKLPLSLTLMPILRVSGTTSKPQTTRTPPDQGQDSSYPLLEHHSFGNWSYKQLSHYQAPKASSSRYWKPPALLNQWCTYSTNSTIKELRPHLCQKYIATSSKTMLQCPKSQKSQKWGHKRGILMSCITTSVEKTRTIVSKFIQ